MADLELGLAKGDIAECWCWEQAMADLARGDIVEYWRLLRLPILLISFQDRIEVSYSLGLGLSIYRLKYPTMEWINLASGHQTTPAFMK